jgi:hypothetical protein
LTWAASDLNRLADAAPRLTHLECQLENDDDDYSSSSAYADHPTMWPCLTSLTVTYHPAYIIRNLQNAHLLRRLVVSNPEADESSLLRALIDKSPPLTSLVMHDGFDCPHGITRSALEAIGSTLEKLEAVANAIDVGRYCPRMRYFIFHEDTEHTQDHITNSDALHIERGCPLMRTVVL